MTMYLGICVIIGPNNERNYTCSFQDTEFNNLRKSRTFGRDLMDSLLKTMQALELANVSQLFTGT